MPAHEDDLPNNEPINLESEVNATNKRKTRGPSQLDYNTVKKAKQVGVQFDAKGRHVGAASIKLSTSARIIVKQIIPVTYPRWDEVPPPLKDKLWLAVKVKIKYVFY